MKIKFEFKLKKKFLEQLSTFYVTPQCHWLHGVNNTADFLHMRISITLFAKVLLHMNEKSGVQNLVILFFNTNCLVNTKVM